MRDEIGDMRDRLIGWAALTATLIGMVIAALGLCGFLG